MAVEETIRIKADLKQAQDEIGKMQKAIEEMAKAQKDASQQIANSTKKNEKNISKLGKAMQGVGKAVKKGTGVFKSFGGVIGGLGIGILIKLGSKLAEIFMENQTVVDAFNVVGQTLAGILQQVIDVMKPVIDNIMEATGGFDALQKVVGGALTIALNSIVLTIQGVQMGFVALRIAYEKVFGSKAGVKRAQKDMQELKEKARETTQRIAEAGKEVGSNLAEAVTEVATAVSMTTEGVTNAIAEIDVKTAVSNAKRVVESKKNFELLALQQQRLVEQYDRQAEELRQIRDDETKTIEERIQANQELGKVLDEQAEAEKNTVRARISAIQDEIAIKGESVELTNELYSLNTELEAIDAKVAGFKSEQLVNENALKKEQIELTQSQKEADAQLRIQDARFKAEQIFDEVERLEKLKEVLEEEKQIELERLQTKIDSYEEGTQARLDAQIEYNARKLELDQQIATAENDINNARSKNEIQWEKLTQDQKMAIVSQGFKNLASVLGEESAAGKAAAIAGTLIDTYQSATSSYKSLAGIPVIGPALGFAASASAVVAGMKTVKQIMATKTPGNKSVPMPDTGGGAPGPGGGTQAPAFNVVGSSGNNQLADMLAESTNKPARAYVVSDDVTSQQGLDRNIVDSASI